MENNNNVNNNNEVINVLTYEQMKELELELELDLMKEEYKEETYREEGVLNSDNKIDLFDYEVSKEVEEASKKAKLEFLRKRKE